MNQASHKQTPFIIIIMMMMIIIKIIIIIIIIIIMIIKIIIIIVMIKIKNNDNNNNNNNNNNNDDTTTTTTNHIYRRKSRFFTISSLRREPSPRTPKWPGRDACANHVQHTERLSRATCDTFHVVRRDSSAIKFDRVEIAFI